MANALLKAIGFNPDDEDKGLFGLPKIKAPKFNIPEPVTNAAKAIASVPQNIASWLKLNEPVNATKNFPAPIRAAIDPALKNIRAGAEVLNFPSYLLGGAIKAGKDYTQGTYAPPTTGIELGNIKGEKADAGMLINPAIVGAIRGVKQKQPLFTEVPKAVGIDPESLPGLAIGLTAEVVGTPGGGKKAVEIAKGEELATVLKNVLKVKTMDMSDEFAEAVKVSLPKAMKALKNFRLDKSLLTALKNGEPIMGNGFTIQAQPKLKQLLINIDKNFNDVALTGAKVAGKTADKVKDITGKISLDDVKTTSPEGIKLLEGPQTPLNLPGQEAQLTGPEYRKFIKKYQRAPKVATNVLDAGNVPIRLPEDTADLSKYGPEFGQFLSDTRTTAFNANTEDLVDKALDAAIANDQLAQQFKIVLKEQDQGVVQNIWQKGVKAISGAANDQLSPVGDLYQSLFKYKVSDLPLDQELMGIERAKIAFESKTTLLYQQSKKAAEEILGRVMTGEETGALLRGDFGKELQLSQKGVTDLNLGADILPKADELSAAFNSVHEEIAASVLMYEKELDLAVQKGLLSIEEAKKMRLVEPEQFATNIKKYVRTFYDRATQELPDTQINLDMANDVAISFSSAKKKLADVEWGRAYLQALGLKTQAQISKSTDIPTDIIERIAAGDKTAIAELGRRVKELRGYVTEGGRSVARTINYLTNQWTDIKTLNLVGDRPDLFSNTFQEGFSKIPQDKRFGPLAGKFIRTDLAKSFERDFIYDKLVADIPGIISWYGAMWRASRTILNAPVWGVNFLTGLLGMQTLAGNTPFNPANWKYFVKASREFPDFIRVGNIASKELKTFLELGGRQSTFADSVILQGIGEAFTEVKSSAGLMDKLYDLAVNASNKMEDVGKLFGSLDAFNKYATFLQKTDQGYSAVEAIQIADKYHLNYDLAPKFVQFFKNTPVLDTLLPFLTFPIQYSRMFVNTAAEKPWRLIPFYLAPQAWNLQWKARNPELADRAEQQKPYYLKGNPFVITLGQTEDGQFKYLDMARFFNIPTDSEQGIRFFTGPFSNTGGPLAAVGDVVRGTDTFGRPLDTPYTETSAQHLLSGTAPIPPIVSQIADIVKTATGRPARGKVRDLSDELLRTVGVSVLTGEPDQLEKNIARLTADFTEWKTYTGKIIRDPNASEAAKNEAAATLMQKQAEYVKDVQAYLQNNTNIQPNNLPLVATGIVQGILGDFSNPLATPQQPTKTPNILDSIASTTRGVKLKTPSVSKPSVSLKKISVPKATKKDAKGIELEPLKPPKRKKPTPTQPSKRVSLADIRSIKAPRVPSLA